MSTRKRVCCPFCEGDGCCFCDHDGYIYIGENEMIKSDEHLNGVGVKFLKQGDKDTNGGLENYPEMWEFFLDEKNVPIAFKNATESNGTRTY